MSAPVMPSAPAVRPSSSGGTPDSGSAESAAPFASALDGALAEGRGTVGDGATRDGEPHDQESPAGGALPGEAGAVAELVAPVSLPALWALALGAPQVAGQAEDAAVTAAGLPGATAAGGAPVTAAPPGAQPAVPAAQALTGAAAPAGAGLPADLAVVPGSGTAASGPAAVPAAAVPGAAGALASPVVPEAVAAATTGATTSAPDTAAAGAPVPAAGPVGPAAASAGAGSTGSDAGGAAPDGEPAAPTSTAATGPAFSTAAAATLDADGATGTAASLPVAGQVARQIAVLRGAPDGSHTMTLVLTPETLGPVEVSVTVTKGTVDLLLRGAHEHGRAALLDALPDLRRDLEAAGLTTSKVEVAKDSGGSWLDRHAAGQQAQQGFGERPGQQGPPDGRSRPWLRPADSGETRTVPTPGAASSGVDVRV